MRLHWLKEAGAVLALLLLTAVGTVLVYQMPTKVTLDVGTPPDAGMVEGFYGAETGGLGHFRWSRGQGRIYLRAVGRERTALLELSLLGVPTAGGQPIPLTVSVNGAVLGEALVEAELAPREEPYRYLFALPPQAGPAGDLVIDLQSPALQPVGVDHRQLGIAVEQVVVYYPGGWGWPPAWPALALLAAVLMAYGAVRLVGLRWPLALALAGGTATLILLALARWLLWVAPNLVALAGALAVIGLLLLVARLLLIRRSLSRTLIALALFIPLPLIWSTILFPPPSFRAAGLFEIPPHLGKFGFALLLPPLGTYDFFPVRAVVFAALALVAVLLWQRLGKWPGWTSAEGAFILVVLVLGLVSLTLYFREKGFAVDHSDDFRALFDGARRFLVAGEPLYDHEAIARNHFGPVYKYPPFFAMLLWPLVHIPFFRAIQVWQMATLFSLLATALLLAQSYRFGRDRWLWAGLAVIMLNWRALWDTLGYGQLDIVLFFLLVGVLAALRDGRGRLAGLLLALAAAIKIYPAFLALFLLLRREWRALLYFGLGMAVLVGSSIVLLGWPVHETYLLEVLPVIGGGTAWVENQTLNGLFNRLLTDRIALLPLTDPRADLAALASAALLLLASGWLVYRYARQGRLTYDLGYALLLTTMLLVLPAAWVHYQTLLILPFVLLLLCCRKGEQVPLPIILTMALAFGLLAAGNAWLFFGREVHGRFWQLLLSYKVFGMGLLWAAQAGLLVYRARVTGRPPLAGRRHKNA